MINTDFDKILRDKLYNCQEQVDSDVWTGIRAKMASRARARVARRICVWSAGAVAACLAAWLLLPSGGDLSISSDGILNMTAEVSSVESQPVASDITGKASGIEVVSSPLPVHKVVSSDDSSSDKPVISEAVSMEEQVKRLEELSAEAVIPEQKTPSSPQQEIQEVSAETDNYISPLDFWNEDDDALLEKANRHSYVSLSSNFASSSTSKGTGNLPMYSPSKLGKEGKAVIPTPTGNHKYYMPLSFGIQAKIPVIGNLSAGIGLNYTYIVTKYDSVLNFQLYENSYNQLHYIGVPIGLYYDLLAGRDNLLNMYAFAGGTIEKCIDSRYVFGTNAIHDDVAGLQCSVNAGFGIEYWLIPRIALYFDPSVVYYFDNNQPINIRTDEPLQIHAEIGLRFKL